VVKVIGVVMLVSSATALGVRMVRLAGHKDATPLPVVRRQPGIVAVRASLGRRLWSATALLWLVALMALATAAAFAAIAIGLNALLNRAV
jgi:hypothetical protein